MDRVSAAGDGQIKRPPGRLRRTGPTELGTWKLKVGSWELEVGSWAFGVGNWKLEVGRLPLAVGSWKFRYASIVLGSAPVGLYSLGVPQHPEGPLHRILGVPPCRATPSP